MPAKRYAAPEPINPERFYLRRTHPKEAVEVVICHGGGELIVRISRDMLRGLCRDASAFYFTGVTSVPWDEI